MITSVKIVSIKTGGLQPLGTEEVMSGIHKEPVKQAWLGFNGFEGDYQADKRHHGGPEKAVHHYPFSHYAYWQQTLGSLPDFRNSSGFGENLTTDPLTEQDVCIGDIWQLDQAIVEVSQARQPCWKLNLRFARQGMARMVQDSRRTGWYYRVLTPGMVATGFNMTLLERPYPDWSVAHLLDVIYGSDGSIKALEQMATINALSESWRKLAKQRLKSGQIEDWCKRLGELSPF